LVQIYLERRDAITRNRDARLTKDGLVLHERDASGALVVAAQKPAASHPSGAEGPAGPSAAGEAAPTPAQDQAPPKPAVAEASDAEPPLPPPPGAVPKPPGHAATPPAKPAKPDSKQPSAAAAESPS
jgi:hypothetical protein